MAAFTTPLSNLRNIFNRDSSLPVTDVSQDAVIVRSKRNIQGLFVDVAISEEHEDELEITDHPTEGSMVSDHAFAKPKELRMVVAWSDSRPQNSSTQGSFGTTTRDIYKKLLDLKDSKQLLSVVTGKRTYSNLLLKSIRVKTDVETEYSLVAELHFREVILVRTKTQSLPPDAFQAQPQKTAAPVNTGSKQPVQVQSQ
jgi:hypothetical protein